MTARDVALKYVARARAIVTAKGFSEYAVTRRLETYDRSIQNGAILTDVDELELSDCRVTAVGGEEATWFGAGTMIADAGKRNVPVTVYRVNRITPAFATGGISEADLLTPPTSPAQRLVFLIVGPFIKPLVAPWGGLLADGGEPFSVATAQRVTTLQNEIILRRAPIIHAAI